MQQVLVEELPILARMEVLHTRRMHLHNLSMYPSQASTPESLVEVLSSDIVASALPPRRGHPAYRLVVLYDNHSYFLSEFTNLFPGKCRR